MNFEQYHRQLSPDEKQNLADAVGSSRAYLSQVANGWRIPGGILTLKIIRHSKGKIPADPESFKRKTL